jgi:hypothetical protein
MARAIFLLLLFANLAFFAWASNFLGVEDTGHEPARVKDQLQADRLAVVAKDAAAPAQACRRIGPVAVLDAERFKIGLGAKSGIKTVLNPIEETSYWVVIPPLSDKAAADKKAVELKRMGIGDFFVVTEAGPYRNAISLGTFSNEETAKDLLDRLGKKGVRSARIDTKLRPSERALLDVRGETGLVTKGLAEVLPAPPPPVADCPPQ